MNVYTGILGIVIYKTVSFSNIDKFRIICQEAHWRLQCMGFEELQIALPRISSTLIVVLIKLHSKRLILMIRSSVLSVVLS
jgi:hypothetical protein